MRKLQVFISSVQQEFSQERQQLAEYLRSDTLLGQFFEPFLFEWLPASDQRADTVYVDAAAKSDIYLGLFGMEYGIADASGLSPTAQEFQAATAAHRTRLVFIHGPVASRHPHMQALVAQAEAQLIRRRFADIVELKTQVYSALVEWLMQHGHIQTAPFDATLSSTATIKDIDPGKVQAFITLAKTKRGFPLSVDASIEDILVHLNLMKAGKLTHAALLLFGSDPQYWFTTSIVKCAQFHGSTISKPIPAQRDLQGDVFELIDGAVDFVLSRLNVGTGTRNTRNDVPISYEIPRTAVAEAIVNAVAHRDYTSNGSVQVMLFSDRLEIWNPGHLPPNLSVDQLKKPHASFPANPLLAEPMYQAGYIERMGTGTGDMIRDCLAAGLGEPVFRQEDMFKTILWRQATPQVTPQVADQVTDQVTDQVADQVADQVPVLVKRLVAVLDQPLKSVEIMSALALKHKPTFRDNYLNPAMAEGYIEMTDPASPNSPRQQYRLTEKGRKIRNLLIRDSKSNLR